MEIINLIDEDFVNFKLPSMFLIFPNCSFKCDKENGMNCCQNSNLAYAPTIQIDAMEIVKRYEDNPITEAIVCGGLEPFDNFNDLYHLTYTLRSIDKDSLLVIYTGYTEAELESMKMLDQITNFHNVIIKFGRFKPGQIPHKDELLGVTLASDNQYSKFYN